MKETGGDRKMHACHFRAVKSLTHHCHALNLNFCIWEIGAQRRKIFLLNDKKDKDRKNISGMYNSNAKYIHGDSLCGSVNVYV